MFVKRKLVIDEQNSVQIFLERLELVNVNVDEFPNECRPGLPMIKAYVIITIIIVINNNDYYRRLS